MTSVSIDSAQKLAPQKRLGNTVNQPGACSCGDPVSIGSGNVYESVTDYQTATPNPLAFTRSYNSLTTAAARTLGGNWRSSYDRSLDLTTTSGKVTAVTAERADGQELNFTPSGTAWISDSDVDVKLVQSGTTWTLTDHDDTVETYTAVSASSALLTAIKARNGYTQALTYNTANQPALVTDSFGRKFIFAYSGGLLKTVTTPDGTVLTYGYTASGQNGTTLDRLASVTYSTNPATSQSYVYENASLPFALTGIIDEDGKRFATWAYDSTGRAISSQHAGGADLTTISYDDSTGNRTVTNALGEKDLYKFATLQGAPKVVEIDRLATATTPAATRTFAYDGNGYLAKQTDWRGVATTYVNNSRGLPTQMTEAAGTSLARVTTTNWATTLHLPTQIAIPGLTTSYTYDSLGETLTRTETASAGSRVWGFSWANHELASIKDPRANVTSFTHDSLGRLTAVTNALSQTTKITASSTGGLPKTIVDPNGVTTTLAYDPRQRLISRSMATSAGARTTSFAYDAAGNLLRTTLPDGSVTAMTYDAAHRPVRTADTTNEQINATLDALGDPTSTSIATAAGAVTWQSLASYDALGRVLVTKRGAGQTTTLAYDGNGNVIKTTDPKGRVTTRTIDALGRVTKIVDPAGGITSFTYDARDRLTGVVAANGASTTYSYDGFGDVTQRISSDTGATYFYYDAAGNLTQTTDAAGIVTKHSYDALNRVTSTTYPGNTAENVTYGYDGSGHGFGIGRLTNVVDAVGSLSLQYDERGLELSETRTHAGVSLTTAYGYDAAGRVASMTAPSGIMAAYAHDMNGQIDSVTIKASGSVAGSIGVGHAPFGPVNSLAYGNGLTETRAYDGDYRLTSLTSGVQSLTYGYDAADNVTGIADGITPGNTQSFGYDSLDHLTTAKGGYGSLAWTYDLVGNRLSETAGGATGATYGYVTKSNRLTANSAGGVTTSFAYTAAGNLATITPATGAGQTLTYTQGQRLASVASGATTLGTYAYDAFGHRFDKVTKTATTWFAYDLAGHLIEETDGTGHAVIDTVSLDGVPVARVAPQTGIVSYLHTDRLGTPQLATSATKSVVWGANYQPFGQLTVPPSGSITQNVRFPGQYADAETGWNQNGFRDYAPLWGRYLESDPIGLAGGVNTYGYVGGNPITRVDSLGLWAFTIQFYDVLGGAIIFGRDPLTGQPFDTFRAGVGFEAGLSFDPNGGRPGAESFCKNQGNGGSATAGVFADIGAGVGAFGIGIGAGGSASAGIDSRTLKGYLDRSVPRSAGYDPGAKTGFGFKLGGSVGFEIGSNDPAEK